ncbi:MAG: 2-amino-4-hydroxy-6-hydroxymethyldihydropteridine diphosphokinase [Pseudomonadota bacterium]
MRLHLIALGANLGLTPEANKRKIASAARKMASWTSCGVLSRFYKTPAWPPASGPDFVNAVMALRAPIPPEAMLDRLHHLERAAGRRRGMRWGARVLDLDLLACDGMVLPSRQVQRFWAGLSPAAQAERVPDRLILPHPRLADRAFVLVPLCDVAPGWRHPVTGRTARAMRDALPARIRREIRPLRSPS